MSYYIQITEQAKQKIAKEAKQKTYIRTNNRTNSEIYKNTYVGLLGEWVFEQFLIETQCRYSNFEKELIEKYNAKSDLCDFVGSKTDVTIDVKTTYNPKGNNLLVSGLGQDMCNMFVLVELLPEDNKPYKLENISTGVIHGGCTSEYLQNKGTYIEKNDYFLLLKSQLQYKPGEILSHFNKKVIGCLLVEQPRQTNLERIPLIREGDLFISQTKGKYHSFVRNARRATSLTNMEDNKLVINFKTTDYSEEQRKDLIQYIMQDFMNVRSVFEKNKE